MTKPLMPMATAVWLVESTALTFRQIAVFCSLHELEVQAIADETVGQNIVGLDPVLGGQLTAEELERCVNDSQADLEIVIDEVPTKIRTKGPRYTPVSRRQDKPDAIAWLIRHHPELSDPQICRLIGTTKPTIMALRERTHWNIQKITPQDPVALGLSRQTELDDAVQIASKRQKAREEREAKRALKKAAKKSAAPVSETAAPQETAAPEEQEALSEKSVSGDEIAPGEETTSGEDAAVAEEAPASPAPEGLTSSSDEGGPGNANDLEEDQATVSDGTASSEDHASAPENEKSAESAESEESKDPTQLESDPEA